MVKQVPTISCARTLISAHTSAGRALRGKRCGPDSGSVTPSRSHLALQAVIQIDGALLTKSCFSVCRWQDVAGRSAFRACSLLPPFPLSPILPAASGQRSHRPGVLTCQKYLCFTACALGSILLLSHLSMRETHSSVSLSEEFPTICGNATSLNLAVST